MASYMRLGFTRKTASLCSSIFNISQQRLYSSNYSTSFIKKSEVRSCFPFWLSLPLQCRHFFSTSTAELSSLSPQSLSMPFLLLPEEEQEVIDENANNSHIVVNISLFSLADNKLVKLLNKRLPEEISDAHCYGSSHGWLAFVNGLKCGIYLANIFSRSVSPEIIQLPSIDTMPHVISVSRDSSSNIVNKYRLRTIRGIYHYSKDVGTTFSPGKHVYTRSPNIMNWELITRFAMSSAPNNGNNNCTVMVSFSEEQNLAFCRIGDTSWTFLKSPLQDIFNEFIEIIFSKKDQLFYALTRRGDLEAWDLHDPSSPKRIHIYGHVRPNYDNLSEDENELLCKFCIHYYLVESSGGDILYVVRYVAFLGEDGSYVDPDEVVDGYNLPYKTVRFDIYKLEFEKQIVKTLPVTSIADSVLFLGYNHSFSLSARDYPDLKRNSIYFADNHHIFKWCPRYKDYPCGGNDVGVYNIEDCSVNRLYHPFGFKKTLGAPMWVFPCND